MAKRLISIEGNIGSGKSTLFEELRRILKDDKRVVFLPEPVFIWETYTDIEGNTILKKFYENNKKYSFSLQILIFVSIFELLNKTIKENPDANIIISERSLFTTKYVFAKMLYDSGDMEDIEYNIYLNLFETFAKNYNIEKMIYVNASPLVCMKRVLKRSRIGENNISLNYLDKCNNYHDIMMSQKLCSEILTIDGNIDIFEEMNQLKKWTNDIINYIGLN